MKADRPLVPSGSQTVGPYFSIGLDSLMERAPANANAAPTKIRGRVLDRDGMPVPDAMLEFWTAGAAVDDDPYPAGFRRVKTDSDGYFSAAVLKPGILPMGDGRTQAPHILVLVFARGLLRHLLTRVYFEDEPANYADPVLQEVPAERRRTLTAHREGQDKNSYRWNVVLQGLDETVFFVW